MNAGLTENYNSVVTSEDECIFVGDVCMGKITETLELLPELTGRKILVLGNHDRPFPAGKDLDKWTKVYENYFDEIHLRTFIEIAGQRVLVNHFPYEMEERDKERYNAAKLAPYYPENEGLWLIHGHTHLQDRGGYDNQIHVGVDADWSDLGIERYHPIPESAIAQVMA